MVNERMVTLSFDCSAHLIQLRDLASRHADEKPDLADLCLVRMSELFPKHSVIPIDRTDFRIFRRNKRGAIPVLCPPEAWMSAHSRGDSRVVSPVSNLGISEKIIGSARGAAGKRSIIQIRMIRVSILS